VAKPSAGLLIYRIKDHKLEVFLVHPGGPLWAHKDEWSIPKGEYLPDEEPLDAAKREFKEETNFDVPAGKIIELKPVKQPSGKVVSAWAIEGDFDASKMNSNLFSMEWPPKSGKRQAFPEVDKGQWFDLETARLKMFKGQVGLLDELEEKIKP
jgi:predicted NUDIX family NTP pyrophosphohydrolase